MKNILELDRTLSAKILESCWKASIAGTIITSLVFFTPFTTSTGYSLIGMIFWNTLGIGIVTYFYKVVQPKNIKYYVNFVLITMIISMAITLRNPEIFSLYYFIMALNISYRDRVLHFVSSGIWLALFLVSTLLFPILLPAPTAEDTTTSLMITKVTIFIMVVFLIDIINHYTLLLTNQLDKNEKEITMAALTDSVGTLVQALEAKDQYTNGHAQRTNKYAQLIFDRLGMIEISQESFITGCLLHDIGKIGMPDSILGKRGNLSAEEFSLIKEHPLIGAKILENAKSLIDVIPMVLSHHERYDGSGYPQGLKGEEIPFEARILAVADAYDAMTSSRPYRDAMSSAQAYMEISDQAGKQFCPKVVKAFVSIYDEIHKAFEMNH
ncbi:MAG: HD-GYP domain-containing protein [Clostridia bacterium]|nr:HD-GYP domain-containing protein [Clostridia bacterium]